MVRSLLPKILIYFLGGWQGNVHDTGNTLKGKNEVKFSILLATAGNSDPALLVKM